MEYKPILTGPDVASATGSISEKAQEVGTIHSELFTFYSGNEGRMGLSDDLSVFTQKFEMALDGISALGNDIGSFRSMVDSIQQCYSDAQEKAIARAMLLPR